MHTGAGKGKSTAAFGLALRMLGRGQRVGVVQFIKGAWHTAERDALAAFGDQVSWHTMGEGFTWETQDRARDIAAAERAWAKSLELMADASFGLVILDELNIALRYEYLDLAAVVAALERAPRRAARRRHRPQRQAGADRGRRSRHRDDAGQAPLRRRREGAAGHRVLGVMTLTVHSISVSCPAKAGHPVTPVPSMELMLRQKRSPVVTGSPGRAGR